MRCERDADSPATRADRLSRRSLLRRGLTGLALTGSGLTTAAPTTARSADLAVRRSASLAQTQPSPQFSQQQKLIATDGDSGDRFGRSVAVSSDGTTALISADEYEDPNGSAAGSVYVFIQSGGSWSQQQKLTAPNGDNDNDFGVSMAVSSDGTTALIGAAEDEDPTGEEVGSVYVFTESGGSWSQQQKLSPSDGDGNDRFGESVAVSSNGTTALIGANQDDADPNGDAEGSAYVFTENEGTWSQQQKLTAADADREERFGFSVAVSSDGTTALIGAAGNVELNADRVGSVYVFTQSGGTWSQQQKLSPSDGTVGDRFGESVAVSGDGTTALIGAEDDEEDPNGAFARSAYVFTESGGTWSQQQKLTPTDVDSADEFGQSVAVSSDGTTALIGDPADAEPNGAFAGSASVFTQSDGTWSQQQKLTADDGDIDNVFGSSVAVSSNGTTALIGAFRDDDPNGEDAGSAYVFSSKDASTGGSSNPSVQATVQQAGTPGGQARVEYTLANVSRQSSVTVEFETLPSALSINPKASDTTGIFDGSTLVFSDPSSSLTSTVAFDIAADLSPPTTVEIDTAVLDETETTTDRVATALEITADSSESPLGGTAGEYDASGDGTITARELGAAVTDFGQGELNARELGEVVTAFGQS